jgi:hypothetical protein
MTEQEWRSIKVHAQGMVHRLHARGVARTRAGRRKLRLFACACCRLAWDRLPDDKLRDAVQVAEDYAEGHVGRAELAAAREAAAGRWAEYGHLRGTPAAVCTAVGMAVAAIDPRPFAAAFYMTAMELPLGGYGGSQVAGEAALCALVSCISPPAGERRRPTKTVSSSPPLVPSPLVGEGWGGGDTPREDSIPCALSARLLTPAGRQE